MDGALIMQFTITQIFSVIWLGILTSISPCPLATNIAATSFIGKQIHSRYATVFAAASYTLGRTLCYVAINLVVVAGLISIPGASNFLQTRMNLIIGPLLFVTGLFILGLIPLWMPTFSPSAEKLQTLGKGGFFGAVFIFQSEFTLAGY